MRKNEIDIITLGCSKNLVDAERLMRQLELAGYRCVHDSANPKGEIAIINTCGFIGDAKEESIDIILQFAERKTKGKLRKLYVMGCLSQRYREELPAEIPEVDKWFGKFDYMGIVEECASAQFKGRPAGYSLKAKGEDYERTITTPKHYAYLKIAEGCNRYCSYCAIPLITGKFTSRPMEEILDEVRWLVSEGVKEFNVIAQDLSSYGLDLYGEHRLAQLVDKMAQIEGVEWIRLHYTYPTDFPYDLLPVMAKHKNVCKYMDIALQHCSDNMLKKMHRHITREEQDAVIARIRKEVPGICIRTTLLVGHPGEMEEDFNELCEWVKEMKFERLGAFAYSEEEGTFAAKHYKDDIPQEEKERRVDTLMAIQQSISSDILSQMVGTRQRVVIDREEEEYYVGRTQYDSPEVDCEVLIEKEAMRREAKGERLEAGNYYEITIIKSEDFDLYGVIEKTT
ncbi:MAG: 30S ribosomal protein S12 methylthiotransferase RimO [Paludibacteraceae bacterium]|nr:30S ribosomal protein S12 methylthiotransferase RimO [Paludibacteraceae bacterium]